MTSPQGRFAREAAQLDGKTLRETEAYGKHLFYHWVDAPSVHVHLGLIGRFRSHRGDVPPPTPQTRLAMGVDGFAAYLSGPMVCRLVDPRDVVGITAPLGPDPLRSAGDGPEFVQRLRRRRLPVAAALLDQRIVAGIGNVYRAEFLFLCGIDPRRSSTDVSAEEAERLWEVAVEHLRTGERTGRIVTVEPDEVGERRRASVTADLALYVYRRADEPCRRCGTVIAEAKVGGRRTWWCPACQPR